MEPFARGSSGYRTKRCRIKGLVISSFKDTWSTWLPDESCPYDLDDLHKWLRAAIQSPIVSPTVATPLPQLTDCQLELNTIPLKLLKWLRYYDKIGYETWRNMFNDEAVVIPSSLMRTVRESLVSGSFSRLVCVQPAVCNSFIL
jgi:hypothetical protein